MRKPIYLTISLFLLLIANVSFCQISGHWTLVGPIQFPTDGVGQINGIGRIEQIKFDPLNPLKMYCTSAGGGLFVSSDTGTTWTSTGTDTTSAYAQAGATAASVCIDYTNDSILYLGTGDANYYSTRYGVWKSTNMGVSWKSSNTGMANRLAVEILMSPKDHNTLIAATNDGIWKSTNGGAIWFEKYMGGKFRDMQFKPNPGTSTIYAATDSSFLVSNDMGSTWTTIVIPVQAAGLQGGGRIGVTKADSNMVYLTFVGDDSANCTPILKSDNSGQSFAVVKPANFCDLNGYDTNSLGGYYQGNYNFYMIVDTKDTNTIYVCANSVWKSTDGGKHWMTYYRWWTGVHTDMHYMTFSPSKPTELFLANDGGVWRTWNGSANWTTASNGLSTTECYHAVNSPIKKNYICTGTQDNAGIYFNNAEPWITYNGGDLTDIFGADYVDSTTEYDIGRGNRQNLLSASQSLKFPFSNGNYDRMDFPPTQPNTAFAADSDIYVTTNLSNNPPTWKQISSFGQPVLAMASSATNANVLYAVTKNGKFYYTNNALSTTPTWTSDTTQSSVVNGSCLATVKNDSNAVYMSCGKYIYKSQDRGATWTNITFNLPKVNIINIYNDAFGPNDAMYLATGDAVWYRDTTMANWLNFSKGLPATCRISNMMMYNDGSANSSLRVSFFGRGVWETPLYRTILSAVTPVKSEGTVTVYPNPNNGSFTVSLQNNNEEAQIEIYNLLGQTVFTSKLNTGKTELNLNTKPAGVYLYKVATKAGLYISSGKVIIE